LRLAQGEAPAAAVAATPDKGRDDIAPAKHWWNRHAPTPAVAAMVRTLRRDRRLPARLP